LASVFRGGFILYKKFEKTATLTDNSSGPFAFIPLWIFIFRPPLATVNREVSSRMCHASTRFQVRLYLAGLLSLALMMYPFLCAWSASDFGGDWQPYPLVDTAKKSSDAAVILSALTDRQAQTALQADQARQEAKLKPYEPFIQGVETELSLKSKADISLVQRLNTIQAVLFGGPQYQDAGELLAKLADVFPKQAAKAHEQLMRQMQSTLPPATSATKHASGQTAKVFPEASSEKRIVRHSDGYLNRYPAVMVPTGQAGTSVTQAVQPSSPKKKHGFWGNDDDDPFANDPFFQDTPSTPQANQSPPTNQNYSPSEKGYNDSQQPSRLKSVGQGIAGLAMMAGSLAGSYYLNKKTPNRPYYDNNYPYGSPYGGYGPYGAYPNQYYGAYPGYGSYGYNNYYGTSPYNPYAGTQYSPYSGTSSISPLGVPAY
jgi:hypothetical protein